MIQNEDGTWTLDEADPTLQAAMAELRRLIDTRDQERRHAAVFTTDNIGDPDNYVTAGVHNNPTYYGHHPEQHAHEEVWDAVVNQGSAHLGSAGIVATIAEVTPSAISIFIENAGDLSAITIASTDAAQRLQGKDADTTVLPVDTTIEKDNVTVEQLGISSSTLTVEGKRSTILECLVTDTGRIVLNADGAGSAWDTVIRDTRFVGCSSSSALELAYLGGSGVIFRVAIEGCRFLSNFGANDLLISTPQTALSISNCSFDPSEGAGASSYTIHSTQLLSELRMDGCRLTQLGVAGGARLSVYRSIIANCLFQRSVASATAYLLEISSPASFPIMSEVVGCVFSGASGTGLLFKCSSADADASGLRLIGNYFNNGIVLGSQDAVWIGNKFDSTVTINFQSKTGMVVIGGDMTGCTLQNIPSDIVFRNVKGQADRGDMLFVDALYDIGKSGATRPRDIFASRSIVAGQDVQVAGSMFASTAFGGFLNSLAILIAQPLTLGSEQFRLTSAATNDDPIESTYQNRVATTDATPTTLHTVAIPASKTVVIEADIIARRTGGAAGTAEDGASYKVIGTYKTVAGVPTVIALTALTGHESQAAWAGTLVVSGTNVLVQVTGAVNNNVTWHCTVKVRMVGT